MRVAAVYVFVAWAAVAQAQTTPIRSWSVTAGGKPYGCTTWGDGQEGSWFTLARQAGISPSGSDALRVTMIPTNDLGDQGWGCGFPGESGSVAQGSVRYVRFRIYFHGPMNWRSDNQGGAYSSNNRTGPDKLFIMANLCNSVSDFTRIILHLYADPPNRATPFLRLTQGTGGAAPADYYEATTNTWLSVQGKIVSSSDGSTEDGATYLYVNNDNEAAPDASEVGQLITTSGWGVGDCPGSQTVFGDGSQNPLSDDVATSAVYDLADFEVDDEFDPNWADALAVPDAPTIGTATAGNAQCVVTFTPPGNDGGATITGYTATSSPSSITGTAASSPITVTGLSNGTGYTFTVVATNSQGNSSASSASNTCTPVAATGTVRLRRK